MKRKRGSKKGHKKVKRIDPAELNDPASTPVSTNAEDATCVNQNDDSGPDSEMDTEPPAVVSDKLSNIPHIEANQPTDNSTGKAGPGRFKVKLKSSRALEPQRCQSDVQTPSETDKSKQQVMGEEDSAHSNGQTPEMQNTISVMVPKKSGSIKIKTSKGVGLSSENVQDKDLNMSTGLGERNSVLSDDEKTSHLLLSKNLQKKGARELYSDPGYNEKELNDALMVIKKIMKMDAAEPFNAPVDPIALGIPDYFEIIDTPMDFGTICHDLEHGYKYMNSEDVFRDVQFIWDNCYKYNNKGDYVVDLMKRVKKNFMKYWMAAGLYSDKPSNGSSEKTHSEDAVIASQDKLDAKGKHKHKGRRHGIDLHKSDCLCAVCVVRRRRKEREKNSAVIESRGKLTYPNLLRESRIEGSSSLDYNCSEDATSSQDHSQETDTNADVVEVENDVKMETPGQRDSGEQVKQDIMDDEMEPLLYARSNREASLHLPLANGDSSKRSHSQELDTTDTSNQKDVAEFYQQGQDEESIHEESAERSQQPISVQELPPLQENHFVFQISKSLFPRKVKSVWNGPHSLMQRRNVPSTRDSPIHAALATFLKQ